MNINKRMNKKGWLKVLEASIAITLLIGVLIYLVSTNIPVKDISGSVYDKEKYILDTISKDNNLRGNILSEDKTNVNATIKNMIPANWAFTTNICELAEICNSAVTPNDRDVYASEIVIASNSTNYSPKKLRLFMWAK